MPRRSTPRAPRRPPMSGRDRRPRFAFDATEVTGAAPAKRQPLRDPPALKTKRPAA